jgi:hypothetical protein
MLVVLELKLAGARKVDEDDEIIERLVDKP